MMRYYGYGMMGGLGFGGGILMFLWWVAVIILFVLFVRWAVGHDHGHHRPHHRRSALDILERRYAKGLIDKKEFDERKKDLV